jgi:hypothetical protein
MLEDVSRPWARATQPVIRRYADHLVAKVAPQTAASVLIGLKVVLKAMHPDGKWRWDVSNRLNAWAEPSVDRSAQTVPIEDIHNACLAELDRLASTALSRRIERVAYRDTLIVLVLSAAPIRRRNLAMIEIGHHLDVGDRSATLRFGEGETKNRQALTYALPRHLLPYIVSYLERIRPTFEPRNGCTRLWLGFEGQPLADHSIYGRIMLVTQRLLDVAVNPHSFRACVATSLAERSSTDARLAAPLLGHRYFPRRSDTTSARDSSRRPVRSILRSRPSVTIRIERDRNDPASRSTPAIPRRTSVKRRSMTNCGFVASMPSARIAPAQRPSAIGRSRGHRCCDPGFRSWWRPSVEARSTSCLRKPWIVSRETKRT